MAGLALRVRMLSVQFETGSSVIKSRVCPLAFGMAIAALGSQRTLMLVIGLVTGETLCCQLDFARWREVTAFTLRCAMLASQCVLGVGIVIELGPPVSHPVTGLTAVTQCAAVLIVLAMTTNTGRWHAFVFTRDVTGRTLHLDVTT